MSAFFLYFLSVLGYCNVTVRLYNGTALREKSQRQMVQKIYQRTNKIVQ